MKAVEYFTYFTTSSKHDPPPQSLGFMKNIRISWLSIILSFLPLYLSAQSNMLTWRELLQEATNHYNEEKYAEALQAFEQAEKLFPTDTFAVVIGAECAIFEENYPLAEKKLENAINFLKVNDPLWYQYYLFVLKTPLKKYPEALSFIEQARSKFPSQDSIQNALDLEELNIYLLTGNLDKAQESLEQLAQKQPDNPQITYNLGVLYAEQGNTEKALESYQKTLALDSRYQDAFYNLGVHYYNEAARSLAQISQMDAETYAQSASSQEKGVIQNFEEARVYFKRLSQLDPTNLEALGSLSTLEANLKNLQANQNLVSNLLSDTPESLQKVKLALADEEIKKAEEAREKLLADSLQKAIQDVKARETERALALQKAEEEKAVLQKALKKQKEEAQKAQTEEKLATLSANQQNLMGEIAQLKSQLSLAETEKIKAEEAARLAAELALQAEEERKLAQNTVREEVEHANRGVQTLLAISGLHFKYEGEDAISLKRGDTGHLTFTVENYGNQAAKNISANLTQPILNPDIQFPNRFVIKELAPGQRQEVDIPISYLENNSITQAVKQIEGALNKMRVFIKDEQGLTLDLLEFAFELEDVTPDSDLDFDVASIGQTNFLLLIGVDDYQGWPPLRNAVKDAQDVRNALWDRYRFEKEHTFELYNDEVVNAKIINVLQKIKSQIGPNDNLVIYYSGHGFYNAEFEAGYWIPYDARKGEEADYFPNETLLKYLKYIDTKHTFLVADACFSGSLFIGSYRGYIDDVESKKSRWGLSSGNLEFVEDGSGENSPFATYLLKYLRDNEKTRFPLSELTQYVKVKVADKTDQTPQASPLRGLGHEGGEFVFYLKQ